MNIRYFSRGCLCCGRLFIKAFRFFCATDLPKVFLSDIFAEMFFNTCVSAFNGAFYYCLKMRYLQKVTLAKNGFFRFFGIFVPILGHSFFALFTKPTDCGKIATMKIE